MQFDEAELRVFFGVPAIPTGAEEREFFSPSEFEVVRGEFILRISFSATHSPKVVAEIVIRGSKYSLLKVQLQDAVSVRVENNPPRLLVLDTEETKATADPRLVERLVVSLEPLNLAIVN